MPNVGYPVPIRYGRHGEPCIAHAICLPGISPILWSPLHGCVWYETFAGLPEDYADAVLTSIMPPPVTEWPCRVINPKNGYSWVPDGEDVRLIDPHGAEIQPTDILSSHQVQLIRGYQRTSYIRATEIWLPYHYSGYRIGRARPESRNLARNRRIFAAHAVLRMPKRQLSADFLAREAAMVGHHVTLPL